MKVIELISFKCKICLTTCSNKARDLLPPVHCRRSLLMNRKQNPENRLMNLYNNKANDINNQDEASLCKAYLGICRKMPNYGFVEIMNFNIWHANFERLFLIY